MSGPYYPDLSPEPRDLLPNGMSGDTISEAHPALYAWAYATEGGKRSFPDAEWILTRPEARTMFEAFAVLVGEAAAANDRANKNANQALWQNERAEKAERESAALREALQHSEEQREASARALGRIAGYDPVEHNRHERQPLTPFETVRKIAREALAGVVPAQPAEEQR